MDHLAVFKEHHKNTGNLLTHIFCGYVSLAILFAD